MNKISIIVPVYKVESYIHRCIDSILGQTFTNFELILIDDGSPDQCPQICDDYQNQDSRVTVIHQKNGGQSAARNSGIEYALNTNTQWVAFIDSDDWIHKRYFELLIATAEKEKVQLVMCQHARVEDYCKDIYVNIWNYSVVDPEKALVPECEGLEAFAWGRIYRKELFSTARFPIGMLMEDFWLIPEVILSVPKVALISEKLYYYYQNPSSTLHTIRFKHYRDIWLGYEKQIALFSNSNMESLKSLQINSYIRMISAGFKYLKAHQNERDYHKNMSYTKSLSKEVLKKYRKYIDLTDRDVSYAVCCIDLKYKFREKMRHCRQKYTGMKIVFIPFAIMKRMYYNFLFPIVHRLYVTNYTKLKRYQCKNRDFSIVCSNCIGGFIYHRLGMQFLSPTINCFFNPRDFVKLCRDIPHYFSSELRFIETEKSYPVAQLDDICVYFNHSKTQEDAARDWNKRKQRVNNNNLYIIAYDQYARNEERLTKNEILQLKNVSCNNLVVLSERDYPDIPYVKTITKSGTGVAELYFDQDKYGVRTFERKFDYVEFLNNKKRMPELDTKRDNDEE